MDNPQISFGEDFQPCSKIHEKVLTTKRAKLLHLSIHPSILYLLSSIIHSSFMLLPLSSVIHSSIDPLLFIYHLSTIFYPSTNPPSFIHSPIYPPSSTIYPSIYPSTLHLLSILSSSHSLSIHPFILHPSSIHPSIYPPPPSFYPCIDLSFLYPSTQSSSILHPSVFHPVSTHSPSCILCLPSIHPSSTLHSSIYSFILYPYVT